MSSRFYQRPTVNAYSELSEKQRRELEAFHVAFAASSDSKVPSRSAAGYPINIPASVRASKVTDKHVPLQNPPGKTSELRANKQKRKQEEKRKKKQAHIRGNKARGLLPRAARKNGSAVAWVTALGLHKLWLGYMAELLSLDVEGSVPMDETVVPTQPEASTSASSNQQDSAMDIDQDPAEKQQLQGQHVQVHSALEQGYSANVISSWHAKLSKADYHGCLMTIKEASNPSLRGLTGIVVQETAGTWCIATPKDQVKVLPKPGNIFTFHLPLKCQKPGETQRLHFDVAGKQFSYRAADRVQRKFKAQVVPSFAPEGLR